ncbi:MAG: hypothetical protein ACLTC4_02090 [Hungatella hathewayi]
MMRIGKRMLAAALAAVMTLGGSVMTSYAGNDKITMINIEIKSEIKVGEVIDSSKIRVSIRPPYSATDIRSPTTVLSGRRIPCRRWMCGWKRSRDITSPCLQKTLR